jgi:hypothetical protein
VWCMSAWPGEGGVDLGAWESEEDLQWAREEGCAHAWVVKGATRTAFAAATSDARCISWVLIPTLFLKSACRPPPPSTQRTWQPGATHSTGALESCPQHGGNTEVLQAPPPLSHAAMPPAPAPSQQVVLPPAARPGSLPSSNVHPSARCLGGQLTVVCSSPAGTAGRPPLAAQLCRIVGV